MEKGKVSSSCFSNEKKTVMGVILKLVLTGRKMGVDLLRFWAQFLAIGSIESKWQQHEDEERVLVCSEFGAEQWRHEWWFNRSGSCVWLSSVQSANTCSVQWEFRECNVVGIQQWRKMEFVQAWIWKLVELLQPTGFGWWLEWIEIDCALTEFDIMVEQLQSVVVVADASNESGWFRKWVLMLCRVWKERDCWMVVLYVSAGDMTWNWVTLRVLSGKNERMNSSEDGWSPIWTGKLVFWPRTRKVLWSHIGRNGRTSTRNWNCYWKLVGWVSVGFLRWAMAILLNIVKTRILLKLSNQDLSLFISVYTKLQVYFFVAS